jgi:ribose 1,5-bisphosphokinase
MSARLVYVIGPSGAGKDSVLGALRGGLQDERQSLHWARRSITRPASAGGEQHEPLDFPAFEATEKTHGFALSWQANGLRYGIRHTELAPLALGHWVFVNGSRGFLPGLLQQYPNATVVHLTASPGVLRQRLLARGRESPTDIETRLTRAGAFCPPAGAIEIHNDDRLDHARQALLEALRSLPGWPSAVAA